MARSKNTVQFDKDHPVFVGIDVHKKNWSIAVVHKGVIAAQMSMPSDFDKLKKTISRYQDHKIYSCYEAGFSGFWLHDKLTEIGVDNTVAAPSKIPVAYGDKVKTDLRDATKLALYLSQGLLKAVHVPTPEQRSFRQLLRTREQIVIKKRATFQQLKSLLIQYNITFDENSPTSRVIEHLRSLPLPEQERYIVDLYIRTYKDLKSEAGKLVRLALKTLNKENTKTFSLIMSAPGVGNITGLALLHEIGDWRRFKNAKQICAYIGLTPREYSSGDHVRKGRITGQGNPWLRGLLIEASWRAVKKDPALNDFYERIAKQTRSKKKAVVAVARKLIARIYAIVKKGELYSPGVC